MYFRNRYTHKNGGDITDEIISVKKEHIPIFKSVEVSYANGKAVVGEGEPVFTRTANYVFDYKHALILAQAIYDFYDSRLAKYILPMATFRDDAEYYDVFTFEYDAEKVAGELVAVDLKPIGKSVFVLYELPIQHERLIRGASR